MDQQRCLGAAELSGHFGFGAEGFGIQRPVGFQNSGLPLGVPIASDMFGFTLGPPTHGNYHIGLRNVGLGG